MLLRYLLHSLACLGLLVGAYWNILTPDVFEGPLESATAHHVMLSRPAGRMYFLVSQDAAVTLDGQDVCLDELRCRQWVRVVAVKDDDGWIATRVHALTYDDRGPAFVARSLRACLCGGRSHEVLIP